MEDKIIILGAGPCGLGAAWRLTEVGYSNFKLFEKSPFPGGLSASFTDDEGFTWDIGGHVLFSHYPYFDQLMDNLMGDEWFVHQRDASVWMDGRFIPYPFQNNLRHLPPAARWKCIEGLLDLQRAPLPEPGNFQEWILATFGRGIAELFMIPYNRKVWACDLEQMAYDWIGDRVSVIDLGRVLRNVVLEEDDLGWGPNSSFRFPRQGGTGEIWRRLCGRLDPTKVFLECPAVGINTADKEISLIDGRTESYDTLISTLPLDLLVEMSDLPPRGPLAFSSTLVVGVGLAGSLPPGLRRKCWIYFPEPDVPFYRVTVFSNYSRYNVPEDGGFWSLMAEVAESPDRRTDPGEIQQRVVEGLRGAGFIEAPGEIASIWHRREERGYPTPLLGRDRRLRVLADLESRSIYSRGRFGAWKYEVGNQDHSLMQGVELVDRLVHGREEITLWNPRQVNRR